jgi:hypothetical protein
MSKIEHLISRVLDNITVEAVFFISALLLTALNSLYSCFDLTLSCSVIVFLGIVALFQSDVLLYFSRNARTLMQLFDENE